MAGRHDAVRVADRVHWVGAVDWGLRDFHGYATHRGTSYNAYLVLADKVTLIDTVKGPFAEELLARIASIVEPRAIDYIVSNHAEMDHSGALLRLIEVARPEKVFASRMGVEALREHFGLAEVEAVADGGRLDLGGRSLTFLEARMLHWPDSMLSYLAEERILFSNDAFGMHLASSERYADELDPAVLEQEAAKYYANILLPYSKLVPRLVEKAAGAGITPEALAMIAPSHGPIWRREVGTIVNWYARWAAQERGSKALVVYDTMWGSTEKMARAIGEGLMEGGASARLMPLRASHRSDVATEVLDAGALVVGSPTLNGGVLPTVADVLTYLRGLRPQGMVGAAFGSYGWAGGAVNQIENLLAEMKVERVQDGIKVRYVPDELALEQCRGLGRAVASKLREARGQGSGA